MSNCSTQIIILYCLYSKLKTNELGILIAFHLYLLYDHLLLIIKIINIESRGKMKKDHKKKNKAGFRTVHTTNAFEYLIIKLLTKRNNDHMITDQGSSIRNILFIWPQVNSYYQECSNAVSMVKQ